MLSIQTQSRGRITTVKMPLVRGEWEAPVAMVWKPAGQTPCKSSSRAGETPWLLSYKELPSPAFWGAWLAIVGDSSFPIILPYCM